MKKLIKKILRFLKINKPIHLSDFEIELLNRIKGWNSDKYPYAGEWIDTLKPLWYKHMGWNPDEWYKDYQVGLYDKLLTLYLKIYKDHSGNNILLKEIITDGLYPSIIRPQTEPYDRIIASLCGHLQIIEVYNNGIKRFNNKFYENKEIKN